MVNLRSLGTSAVALLAAVLFAAASQAQAPTPFPPTPADIKTGTLFLAINHSAPTEVASLKAAEAAGADINRKNWLGYTPLMWASVRGKTAAVELLLKQGAHLNDTSQYGSALTFSLIGRQRAVALALLAKGASIQTTRLDRISPLMFAASDGYADVVQALLKRGAKVSDGDLEGVTALTYAVRAGHRDCARVLIAAGADVNAADMRGTTPLMEAAMCGRPEIAADLVASHANVQARDKSGNTALTYACTRSGSAAIADLLLTHGASAGNSVAVAVACGRSEVAAAIAKRTGAKVPSIPMVTKERIEAACNRGTAIIQSGLKAFQGMAPCGACHHQGIGLMSLGVAADHGVNVDGTVVASYLKQLEDDGRHVGPVIHNALSHPELTGTVGAADIEDLSIGAGYLFNAMLSHHVPANPGLAEGAAFLASLQAPDGRWVYGIDREPMQGSQVTTTALVSNIVVQYGGGADGPLAGSIRRAKQYLAAVRPAETEDAAMKLMGLKWVGASDAEVSSAVSALRSMQNSDGSWSQKPNRPGDAYATGMAVYALRTAAGISGNDPAVKKGASFLVYTQGKEGAWFVPKRTNSANNYFDSGFPYGESQYSSLAGSSWAVMALACVK